MTDSHQEFLNSLPKEWEIVSLSEVGDINSGGTPSRVIASFWNGEIAWVTPGELTKLETKWLTSTREYISKSGLANSGAVLLSTGSLLVTSRATIGEVAIAAIPVATNQGFKNITPRQSSDSVYLYYLLQYIAHEFTRLASGSTFLEISKTEFSAIRVPLPPLDEQRAIADILDTIDAAIQNAERVIAKQKAIRAGLLHDLLTYGLDANGEPRDPIARPEQFKDSPLGLIPREWEVETIGGLFDMQLGKMLSKFAKTGQNQFPYLANKNVQWDRVDLSDIETMHFEMSEQVKFNLLPGDLLICEGGDVGRTAIWHGELDNCYFQKAIHRLRPAKGSILPKYMLRYMRYAVERGLLKNLITQTSISHLTQEKLAMLPVKLPVLNEQSGIVNSLDAEDETISKEETHRDKLIAKKKGLMDDLLTGRVRVGAVRLDEVMGD